MQTSAVTYKIERYTIDQLESKIKTYGKTMSKKKSKKIRKEQAQELSSAEPEHLKLAAEKTASHCKLHQGSGLSSPLQGGYRYSHGEA